MASRIHVTALGDYNLEFELMSRKHASCGTFWQHRSMSGLFDARPGRESSLGLDLPPGNDEEAQIFPGSCLSPAIETYYNTSAVYFVLCSCPDFPRFLSGSRWYPAELTPIRIPPSGNCACIRAWSRRHLRPSFMHTSPSAESETCSSKTPRYRTQPFVERRVNGISLLGIPGPEFAEESDTSSSSVVRLDLVHFFPEDQFCDLDSQL
jgi:hypothetical protein